MKQLHFFLKRILIGLPLVSMIAVQTFSQRLNEDSIKKVIREAKQDSTRLDAMLTYSNYLIKNKRQDSSGIKMLLDTKKLCEEKKYFIGRAQALLILGNYYQDKNDLAKSIQSYEEILKIAPQIPDSIQRIKALYKTYNNLGGIYNRHGDFSTSLENRLKCIQYIESLPHNPTASTIGYINIASDYRQLKEYSKAREYLLKAEKNLPDVPGRLRMEYDYEYYQIILAADDIAGAENILSRMDSSLKVLDLSNEQRLSYSNLTQKTHGIFEMDQKNNYGKALGHFQDELQSAEQWDDQFEIAAALYNIGWAQYALKNYPASIGSLKKSYELSIQSDFKNTAFKAANMLAKSYEELNNLKNGLFYSKEALRLKDSIVSDDRVSQLNFLEAKYQNEKKEKEIAQLTTLNVENELAVVKRNRVLLIGGLIALALLLVLALLFRAAKQKHTIAEKDKKIREDQIRFLERQQQVVSLQSMINGQESERTRVAKDLHDGLGGIFSTVKMHYSTLQQETPAVKENPLYKRTLDLINNASDELRKVAHNMMPEVLMKVGLVEALQDFCSNISSGKLLKINLQTFGMEKRLASSTEIMLYRIIQELVNNIIKHAYATEAIIQINREGNRLCLTIEDNGKGFDTREAEEKRSMGMATVKSRVDYLNGKLTIDSRKNIGTTVMIDLLLNEN